MKTKAIIYSLVNLVIGILSIVVFKGESSAIPTLQLDIKGGTYNNSTQTIMSSGDAFELYAYLIPDSQGKSILSDTYYISAAVVPKLGLTDPRPNLGSFIFDYNNISVAGGMTYGVPPLENFVSLQCSDPGDLSSHGIFDTYFSEFSFNFSSANQISPYNTQDRAKSGAPINMSGTGMYYAKFNVDTSNMTDGYAIHFDLYNEKCARGSNCNDLDANQFAPFSHDAESPQQHTPVPEPGTLVLLGTGFIGVAFASRFLKRSNYSGKK